MSNKKAKEALNQMKQEAANTVGVNLKQGYNGDLTSREAGSVGGQMVKKMCTVRTMSFRRDGEAHDRKLRERPFCQVTFPIPTPAAMPSAGRGRSFCLSTAKLAKPAQ